MMEIALFGGFMDLASDEWQGAMKEVGKHQCH